MNLKQIVQNCVRKPVSYVTLGAVLLGGCAYNHSNTRTNIPALSGAEQEAYDVVDRMMQCKDKESARKIFYDFADKNRDGEADKGEIGNALDSFFKNHNEIVYSKLTHEYKIILSNRMNAYEKIADKYAGNNNGDKEDGEKEKLESLISKFPALQLIIEEINKFTFF